MTDTRSLGILNLALSYLKASSVLNDNIQNIGPFRFAPVYFSVCHSIELSLKAFLAQMGKDDDYLINLRHNLEKILEECSSAGMEISYGDKYTIENLNIYIKDHEFRYVKLGVKTLPEINEAINCAMNIYNQVADAVPTARRVA